MKTNLYFWYVAHFFLEWEIFQTKVVEKIKTHILCSITFLQKLCCLCHDLEEYCRAWQVTYDNMVHAHPMIDM